MNKGEVGSSEKSTQCAIQTLNKTESTVKPGNSKLFEKQQKVYYFQEFTIEEVIYVINRLKSSQKKFTLNKTYTGLKSMLQNF